MKQIKLITFIHEHFLFNPNTQENLIREHCFVFFKYFYTVQLLESFDLIELWIDDIETSSRQY